jgi:hypothetical protein
MNPYNCKCDEPATFISKGNAECLACGGDVEGAVPLDRNYRGMEKPPVPFYALDSALVASMHAEMRVLYELLGESFWVGDNGIYVAVSEEEISKRIQERT